MPELTTARDVLTTVNEEFDLDGTVEHHDEELASVSLRFARETGIECTINVWLEDRKYAVEANIWQDDYDEGVRRWTHLSPTVVSEDLLRTTVEAKVQDILGMGTWDLTHEKSLQQ